MDLNENLSIEEYKHAKERINKNEERRYQLLVLNITGFGAVFGFSGKISDPLVPLVLLGILMVCTRSYSLQTRLQRFNAAYFIERFEKNNNVLKLETGYALWHVRGFKRKEPSLFKILRFFLDPFIILLAISLIGGGILCFNWLSKIWLLGQKYWVIIYVLAIFLGHVPIFLSIKTYRGYELEVFQKWWRNYLNPVKKSDKEIANKH